MAIATAQITLTDGGSAVQLVAAGITKKFVVVKRITSNSEVYVGTSAVSVSNGMKVTDDYLQLTIDIGDTLYGISLTGYGNDLVAVYSSTVLL